jgi:hypothetical protein
MVGVDGENLSELLQRSIQRGAGGGRGGGVMYRRAGSGIQKVELAVVSGANET